MEELEIKWKSVSISTQNKLVKIYPNKWLKVYSKPGPWLALSCMVSESYTSIWRNYNPSNDNLGHVGINRNNL